MRIGEGVRVAAISLAFTWLFFAEYTPPAKRVHIWSDIEGYHYPLLNYTHKSVWEGRIPLWDPWIYCGIPFAGNIQAGLFYPPNWLLYVANARMPDHLRNPEGKPVDGTSQRGMRYTSIEIFAFLHAWLAFFLTYLWLRGRTLHWLPAVLGGTVAGYSGYLLSQMNHLGVACGYAWMPFALWGIDQASSSANWRKLWKVAVASALALFAGYPPTWVALLIIAVAYAAALPGRTRLVPMVCGAILVSLLLGAVQLLPVYEATRLKTPEMSFGGELPFGNGIYATMVLPNYFDQNRTNDGPEVADGDYLYLGVPVLFGLLYFFRRGWYRGAGAALTVAGTVLFIAADPTGLVLRVIEHLPVVPDALRRYNLIAGIPLAGALLAASAVDDLLRRTDRRPIPRWAQLVWIAIALAWVGYLVWLWPPGGPEFLTGAASAIYPAVLLVIFSAGLWMFARQRAVFLAAFALFAIAAEYKAFGTDRRFNAVTGNTDSYWRGDARLGGPALNGLDTKVYHQMLANRAYRVAIVEGPHSTDMRHYGIPTLQGFDPFLPDQYKAAVEAFIPFTTNRLFDVNPLDEKMLRHFGVRWVLLRHESPLEATLLKHPSFRQMQPATSYYTVFEYLQAEPPWRYNGEAVLASWMPERRTFRVRSATGGVFVNKEQFFPGWQATIDGAEVPITRADGVFQSINIPAGEHTIEFRYAPRSLYTGAAVSLAGFLGLVVGAWPRRRAKLLT